MAAVKHQENDRHSRTHHRYNNRRNRNHRQRLHRRPRPSTTVGQRTGQPGVLPLGTNTPSGVGKEQIMRTTSLVSIFPHARPLRWCIAGK